MIRKKEKKKKNESEQEEKPGRSVLSPGGHSPFPYLPSAVPRLPTAPSHLSLTPVPPSLPSPPFPYLLQPNLFLPYLWLINSPAFPYLCLITYLSLPHLTFSLCPIGMSCVPPPLPYLTLPYLTCLSLTVTSLYLHLCLRYLSLINSPVLPFTLLFPYVLLLCHATLPNLTLPALA